jgi:hypothetical protein
VKKLKKKTVPKGLNYSIDLEPSNPDGATEISLAGIDEETKDKLHSLLKELVGGN